MTWCSENSTVPGFVLASSAIHRRFVDRFAGFMPPPVFPADGSLDASLSSFGSRRARFPALSGTMKALRLPIRLSPVAHWFAPEAHPIPPASCSPQRSRKVGGPFQARALGDRLPVSPASLVWTRMGSLRSSGDPSRAFAPLQDPGRTNVPSPLSGTSMLPPLDGRRRLRQCLISGLTRSFGTRCRTLHAGVAAHVQGLLPAGRLAFAERASNPLDRDERFQLVLTIIPLSCSPDATTLRDGVAAIAGVAKEYHKKGSRKDRHAPSPIPPSPTSRDCAAGPRRCP